MASRKRIKKKQITQDCWSLDFAFYKWLDERLPVYYKDANKMVDLTFYAFEFRGEKLTEEECIKRMLKLLELMRGHDNWDEGFYEYAKELRELWCICAPVLWW